ncbi:uncharacterized protein LOC142895202 [Nelusetta ayraudi]|uniref:uncharacterized protein LOC142895202 n=1 Tax=Nelusetta ayraudi TaxID=303726 RepID=UPI003F70BFFF
MNSSSSSRTRSAEDVEEPLNGVPNPTACLHVGDIILFTLSTHHYPEYDLDNLYNTNSDFDWGAFRQLQEEMTLSWTPPSFFSLVFSQPGVYVFKLSSNQNKHMYVRVMPAGVQCFESGPFFPSTPRHVTRLGIRRRRNLLLRPDWLVTGGLLAGAVIILCTCVTLLLLFREYGWPEKQQIRVRYRSLQSAFHMEDYSSKGSMVTSRRKIHRNQQARMSADSTQPDVLDEFWDYEHQVDLEAFSSTTFYNILLKQSLSVTTRLGQLTAEVKELHQGVLGKLQPLHPCLIAEERMGHGHDRVRMEVQGEVERRQNLATQLRNLLGSQLEVLRREQQAQQSVFTVFTGQLRECTRLLSRIHGNQPSCEVHGQNLVRRLTSLVDEMSEQVSAECRRQGAWGLLGEGTGAKLFCADTRTVLGKEHIFGPDGSMRDGLALYCDSLTGLIRPSAHSHMLLSNGHIVAVPDDYFLHPHTGRLLPIAGNVAYDPVSSSLVFTTDLCAGENRKWETALIPFIKYPTPRHSDQPLDGPAWLRGLRPGQKLELGCPMADPDTGVPVPILAVTIHPQTGLVYPLGGLHVCPLTRMPQPIQIGSPVLEPRLGKLVLTVGVGLDPATGAVLPVGGVLLGESIIEPLSGKMVRVGGASVRPGQLFPNAGGHQALLDSKVLAVMLEVLELLKPLADQWGSDKTLQHHLCSERESAQHDYLVTAAKELQQAWARSLHCQLQLHTRLKVLLDWAVSVEQDGGILGEMPLPHSDMCVPALLGMEYPDPVGSGLSVPVLGCQSDISGNKIPLAGTMEDPGGKGLVAIRYGSQTVDPVTEVLAPVVGARLDVSRKKIVPVTSFYWLLMADQTDNIQVEALQREVCARNDHWQQQRRREADLLSDLDSALVQCVAEANSSQWCGGQLREVATELQRSAQAEAQRRVTQGCRLALVLPAYVLDALTLGDGEEWDRLCAWHSELSSALERLEVSAEQLKQDQEKRATQGGDWEANCRAQARGLRQTGCWEAWFSWRADVEAALNALDCARQVCQVGAEAAQAILSGNFWHKEYGLLQRCTHRPAVKVTALLQQLALPLLEKLNTLLEDKQPAGLSTSTCRQSVSATQSAPDRARGNTSMDVLDAQWECEGELIPLALSDLNPRETLVYQHGLFLIEAMNRLTLAPAVSLQIAAALPHNNYSDNAFRNSFFYQGSRRTLFIRRQRLQSAGGFSLLLLHCLSHVALQDMSCDSSPAFRRLFFRMLQECLSLELLRSRQDIAPSEEEAGSCVPSRAGPSEGSPPSSSAASPPHRALGPTRGSALLEGLTAPDPSVVVRVRDLFGATVANLVEAMQKFGAISYVVHMPKTHQALVEYEGMVGSSAAVNAAISQFYVADHRTYIDYSTKQKLSRGGDSENHRNITKVLLLTFTNSITTDILYICNKCGPVQRIVIFGKNRVQAMVEFDSVQSALHAKDSLNGANNDTGCGILKVEYAKRTRLTVFRNDQDTWDYTNPDLGSIDDVNTNPSSNHRQPSLLGDYPSDYRDCYHGYEDSSLAYEGRCIGPPIRGCSGRRHWPSYECLPPPPGKSPVVMLHGLDPVKMNADRVFNLFCLYGNVERVKFMKNKPGAALVEMGDYYAADRAITHLNNTFLFSQRINLCVSKQLAIRPGYCYELEDGTGSFKDFHSSRNNRFTFRKEADKIRIQHPSNILYFFNAPPDVTPEVFSKICEEMGVKSPVNVNIFTGKIISAPSDRKVAGLLEWDSVSNTMDALAMMNHYQLKNETWPHPYTLKLCFSVQHAS